jgi:hypothetical protein
MLWELTLVELARVYCSVEVSGYNPVFEAWGFSQMYRC